MMQTSMRKRMDLRVGYPRVFCTITIVDEQVTTSAVDKRGFHIQIS